MSKGKKDVFDYQPANPYDDKIPNLKGEIPEPPVQQAPQAPVKKVESTTPSQVSDAPVANNEAKESARSIIARLKQNIEGGSSSNQPTKITHSPRIVEEGVIDPDAEQFEVASNVVMPDPNSNMAFNIKSRVHKNVDEHKYQYEDIRSKMQRLQKDIRITIQPDELKKIVKRFKHLIVKTTKKEVIIKFKKFGFEFYKNNNDGKWWVVALKFEEPFNPKDCRFVTFWSGNTFIGYGLPTLEECFEQADYLMMSGRTGDVPVRDYVTGWLPDKNRFLAGDEPKSFTWKEYSKLIKWYEENKIRIHVKEESVKDYEDLMEEVKAKKARGEKVSPLASLQAKILDVPRKAVNIFGYPVASSKKLGEDITKADAKLYQIAFGFVE